MARQRTLRHAIECKGVGLHSGCQVDMVLYPSAPDTGIVFRRTDVQGGTIPALWSAVGDTKLNTCLVNENGVTVRTVEHLMAAFAAKGIDNALVELNGGEIPVMDGSSAPFLFLIECAGIEIQAAPRQAIKVLKPVTVGEGNWTASLTPNGGRGMSLRVEVEFPSAFIGRQLFSGTFDEAAFKSDLSRARTFCMEQEVEAIQAAGLGRGGSLENTVVVARDGRSVLNEEGLRYPDEFVRHKALDAVGDLCLAGRPILGAFKGVRSGHALNNMLLRALFADRDAWTLVTLRDQALPFAGASGFLPAVAVAAPV